MLALFEVLKEIQINIRYVCMCKSIALYLLHTIHSIDVITKLQRNMFLLSSINRMRIIVLLLTRTHPHYIGFRINYITLLNDEVHSKPIRVEFPGTLMYTFKKLKINEIINYNGTLGSQLDGYSLLHFIVKSIIQQMHGTLYIQ